MTEILEHTLENIRGEEYQYHIIKNAISDDVVNLAHLYYKSKFQGRKDYRFKHGDYIYHAYNGVHPYMCYDDHDDFTHVMMLSVTDQIRKNISKNLCPLSATTRLYENGNSCHFVENKSNECTIQYVAIMPIFRTYSGLKRSSDTILTNGTIKKYGVIDLGLGDILIYDPSKLRMERQLKYEDLMCEVQFNFANLNDVDYSYINYPYFGDEEFEYA